MNKISINLRVNFQIAIINIYSFYSKVFKITLLISFSLAIIILNVTKINAQNAGVGINMTGAAPNSKALLDIDVTGMSSKAGVLFPRITSQERDAITSPVPESLIIYNTDTHCFEAYYNNGWIAFGCLGECQVPLQPAIGTNTPALNQIVWNWNSVSGATNYQWNTSSIYPGPGINSVPGPSYTQTGLTCGTDYSLFVWADNICGYSPVTALIQSTSGCCSSYIACGGSGNITTIAGNGIAGYSGDGGQAICAELNPPNAIAVDGSGNVYIADWGNHRIRKVTASTGIITTIAGNGTGGYNGDGISATSAELNYPAGVAVDASGNVYIADDGNNRIRKLYFSSGLIGTIAGNGTAGFTGDGGVATNAELNNPQAVACNSAGTIVYISDESNQRVREVNALGIINTIAGNGTAGYSGDGGPATNAEIWGTPDVSFSVSPDASGNVYIADMGNNRIRKITGTIINTIAGNGTAGFTGDGIPSTIAELNYPSAITFDASGNMYIADWWNLRVRKVNTSGIISTIAGNGTAGFSGDGGPATNAQFLYPMGVGVDNSGNLFILDWLNKRIREVCK